MMARSRLLVLAAWLAAALADNRVISDYTPVVAMFSGGHFCLKAAAFGRTGGASQMPGGHAVRTPLFLDSRPPFDSAALLMRTYMVPLKPSDGPPTPIEACGSVNASSNNMTGLLVANAHISLYVDPQTGLPRCGECFEVLCTDPACVNSETKSVTITVSGSCRCSAAPNSAPAPEYAAPLLGPDSRSRCCSSQPEIELSRTAFESIWGPASPSDSFQAWMRRVDCSANGTIAIELDTTSGVNSELSLRLVNVAGPGSFSRVFVSSGKGAGKSCPLAEGRASSDRSKGASGPAGSSDNATYLPMNQTWGATWTADLSSYQVGPFPWTLTAFADFTGEEAVFPGVIQPWMLRGDALPQQQAQQDGGFSLPGYLDIATTVQLKLPSGQQGTTFATDHVHQAPPAQQATTCRDAPGLLAVPGLQTALSCQQLQGMGGCQTSFIQVQCPSTCGLCTPPSSGSGSLGQQPTQTAAAGTQPAEQQPLPYQQPGQASVPLLPSQQAEQPLPYQQQQTPPYAQQQQQGATQQQQQPPYAQQQQPQGASTGQSPAATATGQTAGQQLQQPLPAQAQQQPQGQQQQQQPQGQVRPSGISSGGPQSGSPQPLQPLYPAATKGAANSTITTLGGLTCTIPYTRNGVSYTSCVKFQVRRPSPASAKGPWLACVTREPQPSSPPLSWLQSLASATWCFTTSGIWDLCPQGS